MVFVFFIVSNLIMNLVLTVYNLVLLIEDGKYDVRLNYVTFIPISIRENRYVIWASSGVVILITFFFIFPVILLFSVHIKNFC